MYLGILLASAGGYLLIRKIIDRRVEKNTDTEVVRENEEYLGTWASKSDSGFTMFPEGGNDPKYFPRLYAINQKGDTLFNYYVRYLTKYDMTIDKVDKMMLSPNNVFDTLAFTFYRIKQ